MPDPTDPDTNAAIWKSEEVARNFAALSEQREQQRRDQLQLVARLLPFGPDDAFTFMDLGAGTGAASRALLAEYPKANAILCEYSPQMAAEGTRAMAAHAEEYLYTEFRDSAPAQREALPSIVQRVRKLVRGRVGGR